MTGSNLWSLRVKGVAVPTRPIPCLRSTPHRRSPQPPATRGQMVLHLVLRGVVSGEPLATPHRVGHGLGDRALGIEGPILALGRSPSMYPVYDLGSGRCRSSRRSRGCGSWPPTANSASMPSLCPSPTSSRHGNSATSAAAGWCSCPELRSWSHPPRSLLARRCSTASPKCQRQNGIRRNGEL